MPDLLSNRSVYIEGGVAYVPMSDQVSLVMDEFRRMLSAALEVSGLTWSRMRMKINQCGDIIGNCKGITKDGRG